MHIQACSHNFQLIKVVYTDRTRTEVLGVILCSCNKHTHLCALQDAKPMYFLSERGKLSFAHRIDWCLSSDANQASADAIFVRQGMFDRSAVFESCTGHHLMTMHQFLGASNIITWRSKTYRCAFS